MKRHTYSSCFRRLLALGLFLLVLLAPDGPAGAASGAVPPERARLVVVSDDNFPPYIFREASGKLRGILPDQWALWEQKTGVKVDLQATDWLKAQRLIQEGRADVIDTIFFNEERAKFFAFTPAYARINVPVYAHKALGGISDIASLKGFTIGVKAGDAVIGHLQRHGIDSLKEYPSFEAIVLAAKSQEIKVFSVDEPAAVYFLYKHGISAEFRRSFVLYTGEFHRAVPKQRLDLLERVQEGFGKISPQEYRAIDQRWMGEPILHKESLRRWRPWLLGGLAAILTLVLGNILLGRRVHAKTAELHTALEQLRQSLADRQKSEESLLASHEYFATVFNSINDALFIHDAATFQILDVNQRMLTMYGFPSREEALASLTPTNGGRPPYSVQDAFEWLRKARDEGPQIFEWLAKHHDGHCFWVEVNICKGKIGPNDRLIVTVRDITAHKQAEAALRETHELFMLFMRHSPIYIYIKEVTATESRVLIASDNFQQMIGIPGSKMLGRPMEELFPPEFAAKITADDRAVVTKGEVLKLDEDLNGRHYTTIKFPIVQEGKALLAGYTIDITDRKRAEQALAFTLERYDLLAKQNRIVTWEIDAQGQYTHLGTEVSEVTKRRPDELVGKTYFYDLHPAEGREAFKAKVFDCMRKGEPIKNLVHPVMTESGAIAWVSSSGIPTRDSQGAILGYWGTSTDITDRKRAEEEKDALQEQLMHAQKLESVGRLAGGVAHDFNNMLQAILSYTEMALEQVASSQPLYADLKEIQKAAQRSANLTRQLQTFARKQAVATQALNINRAVEGMSEMLRRIIGKDITLEWKPGRDIGTVMLDHGQFDQIVVNMCINARDALENNGTITIETDNVEIPPAEARPLDGITPGAYVRLTFRDNGSGMSPEVRDRIFEPFFTTKHPGQGTGLGLSIVYGIVTQNGGHIRVESEPAKGSVFHLFLPRCATGPAAPETPAPSAPPKASDAKGTILLVDDEESILRPTRRTLENLGFTVLATASPKDALLLFAEHQHRIDLLITDVVMPEMSGPELVRQILKQRPSLKHVFISGHTANLLAGKGLSQVNKNCIQKPFTGSTLAQKVLEVLAKT